MALGGGGDRWGETGGERETEEGRRIRETGEGDKWGRRVGNGEGEGGKGPGAMRATAPEPLPSAAEWCRSGWGGPWTRQGKPVAARPMGEGERRGRRVGETGRVKETVGECGLGGQVGETGEGDRCET